METKGPINTPEPDKSYVNCEINEFKVLNNTVLY